MGKLSGEEKGAAVVAFLFSGATGHGKGFVLTFEYFDLETRDA